MKQYGLENVHLEPYTIPRGWERGPVVARIVEPNGAWVQAAQMAWTPGTRGTVVGPVVMFNPTSEADLAQYAVKLHGAIVLTGRISDRLGGGGGGMMVVPLKNAPPP